MAEQYARYMLADSTTFRTLVSAADRAAALEHIFEEGLPAPANNAAEYSDSELDTYGPVAISWTDTDEGYSADLAAEPPEFIDAGKVGFNCYVDVPAAIAADRQEVGRWAKNLIGGLASDLKSLARQNTGGEYLAFHRMVVRGYWRSTEDEEVSQRDYIVFVIELEYGVGE